MTDSEMLKWIAEHLSSFELGVYHSRMEYITTEGHSKTVRVSESDTMDDVDVLKRCIEKAVEDENAHKI